MNCIELSELYLHPVHGNCNIPILIIDDFGMAKHTQWEQQTFTKIIDKRISNKRITIFTSNVRFQQIREKYDDDRLPSRLEAMTLFVPMPEEDIRVRLANEMKRKIVKDIFE